GGLLGAILALPVTAAARDVYRYVFHRVDVVPATPDEALAMIVARTGDRRGRVAEPGGGAGSEPGQIPPAHVGQAAASGPDEERPVRHTPAADGDKDRAARA
ncbi:MAG TPA: hypothetical protein VGO64_11065, partial [Candidatus Limnocylindrales bacterium]|nr:hypothetical protein [Candidatus Limnocylindrales bacterium]